MPINHVVDMGPAQETSLVGGVRGRGIQVRREPSPPSAPLSGPAKFGRPKFQMQKGIGAVPVQVSRPAYIGGGGNCGGVMGQEEPGAPVERPKENRVTMNRKEAEIFLLDLDAITAPIEGAVAEGADDVCIRDLSAGQYPIVIKVRDRIRAEYDSGATEFYLTNGEMTVLAKAMECAKALDSQKTIRTTVVVGAGAAAALLIFLL